MCASFFVSQNKKKRFKIFILQKKYRINNRKKIFYTMIFKSGVKQKKNII